MLFQIIEVSCPRTGEECHFFAALKGDCRDLVAERLFRKRQAEQEMLCSEGSWLICFISMWIRNYKQSSEYRESWFIVLSLRWVLRSYKGLDFYLSMLTLYINQFPDHIGSSLHQHKEGRNWSCFSMWRGDKRGADGDLGWYFCLFLSQVRLSHFKPSGKGVKVLRGFKEKSWLIGKSESCPSWSESQRGK